MARIGSPRTATRGGSRAPVEIGAVNRRPGVAIRKGWPRTKIMIAAPRPIGPGASWRRAHGVPDVPLRAKPPPRRDCCGPMVATIKSSRAAPRRAGGLFVVVIIGVALDLLPDAVRGGQMNAHFLWHRAP